MTAIVVTAAIESTATAMIRIPGTRVTETQTGRTDQIGLKIVIATHFPVSKWRMILVGEVWWSKDTHFHVVDQSVRAMAGQSQDRFHIITVKQPAVSVNLRLSVVQDVKVQVVLSAMSAAAGIEKSRV